ncbi:MAG: helix-hairpin-helix domain-containing protein, partial [Clostridia bacterium]|nr:helix-hairpin-helix domain-containing protein [Clostridia bacterium]
SSIPSDESHAVNYPRQEKMQPTEHLSINTADTNALKRVPGIGSYFARKINLEFSKNITFTLNYYIIYSQSK